MTSTTLCVFCDDAIKTMERCMGYNKVYISTGETEEHSLFVVSVDCYDPPSLINSFTVRFVHDKLSKRSTDRFSAWCLVPENCVQNCNNFNEAFFIMPAYLKRFLVMIENISGIPLSQHGADWLIDKIYQ
jgi:hypothetical protein